MTARLPSLNGLRAFEAAARHLSFTNAAGELNVTQTAISHQIRRLEEELGIRLFVRQNRALTLTPEARDYLPGVRAAFNDLRLATDRLLRKDNEHVLTVSTLASLAAKWLLPRLSSFQEAHPGIDVRITTSTSLVDFERDDVRPILAGSTLLLSMLVSLLILPGSLLVSLAGTVAMVVVLSVSVATVVGPAILTLVGEGVNRWRLGKPQSADRSAVMRFVNGALRRPLLAACVIGAILLALAAPAVGLKLGPPR